MIAKEAQMTRIKKFVLTAVLLVVTGQSGPGGATSKTAFRDQYKLSVCMESDYDMNGLQDTVNYKVDKIMGTYIENAVSGVRNIINNRKKKGYIRAIQTELPGAPHRGEQTYHCLYGQYTQFNRALAENNEPTDIIPTVHNAHQSTSSFIQQMTKMYNDPEYSGAIRRGHLYTTRSEYNRALNGYVKSKTPKNFNGNVDSLHAVYKEKFDKDNFCAASLNPGSIIIVDGGHAVMYLGQGKIKNNQFVCDTNGPAIVCAYNVEHPAIELSSWRTNHASAFDMEKIVENRVKAEMLAKQRVKREEMAQRYALAGCGNQYNLRQR